MFLFEYFFSYGIFLQLIALVHFAKRRPEYFWLWIIFFGGGLGAVAYLLIEALPDWTQTGGMRVFSHRGRVRELEATVEQNPSSGNYEELADLYFEARKYKRAKDAYDKAISSRTDHPDPFYKRGVCKFELGDYPGAISDLERVVAADPKFDFGRAAGVLARAYMRTGQADKAKPLFEQVASFSMLTETQYYYAEYLAGSGDKEKAREIVNTILANKRTMSGFQKRLDRPWLRKAAGLRRQLA